MKETSGQGQRQGQGQGQDPVAVTRKRNRTVVPGQANAMAGKRVFMAVEKHANFTIFQDGPTGNLFVR